MTEIAALVLPADAVSSSAPVNFQGFPGTFVPGKPVSVDALAAAAGLSPRELTDLAHELGLPLKKTKAGEKDAAIVWPENHVPPGGSVTEALGDSDDGSAAADEPAVEPAGAEA